MNKKYVDFDGVILDTEETLFHEWRKNPNHKSEPEEKKIEYIKQQNWYEILRNSSDINDALYILKNSNPDDFIILTKIHSLENEGVEKIKFLRENNIKQNIILVPHNLRKSDIVNPTGNILIDDSLRNLDDWKNAFGIPILFDLKGTNIDSWNVYNDRGYQRTKTINIK